MEELRTIVTAEEEARLKAQNSDGDKDRVFLQQWTMPEGFPACPVGITLLRQFAETYPNLYDGIVAKNIDGHQSFPALAKNPLWIAYRHHWGTCDDCMEA